MTDLVIRPMGEAAVLVELPDLSAALDWRQALLDDPAPGQSDVVVGARTVLVRFDGVDRAAVLQHLDHLDPPRCEPDGAVVVIDTVYDGTDLDEVGRLTGLGPAGVVDAHTATRWTVGFVGFAPGFGYLVGGDPRLSVPRRDHPRTAVPAGSVGLAGPFSGIYPRRSPGGWQLIGRTDAPLWDLARAQPALLVPGVTVQFRALR